MRTARGARRGIGLNKLGESFMGDFRRPVKHVLTGLITTLLAAGTITLATTAPAAADPAPVAQRSAEGVTADALPTVQINGVAWDQVVVGDTVYVGGSF